MSESEVGSAWNLPDVPGEMLASAEDHAAFAITTTLKGLCWCGAVALCDARGEGERVVGGDEGSHVFLIVFGG